MPWFVPGRRNPREQWSGLVLYPATRCCAVRTCPWDASPNEEHLGMCLEHKAGWRHSHERAQLHYPLPFQKENPKHTEALARFLHRMEQEDISRSWLKPSFPTKA